MGNRLTKIYTRTGDEGTTGLGDGSRVGKDSLRMEAIGTCDEVNAHIGVLLAEMNPDDALALEFLRIQHDLFDLGGELACPGYQMIQQARIDELEAVMDALNATLPPLKEFILPGGSRVAALAHVARTVCRRAERVVVALGREVEVNKPARIYLNRLSDFLFIACRILARRDGGKEVLWQRAQLTKAGQSQAAPLTPEESPKRARAKRVKTASENT